MGRKEIMDDDDKQKFWDILKSPPPKQPPYVVRHYEDDEYVEYEYSDGSLVSWYKAVEEELLEAAKKHGLL